jgi:hypothetical protein
MRRSHLPATAILTALATSPAAAQTFDAGFSASWLAQIGVTSAIETTAKSGQGFGLGMVDTGVVADHPELVGRVSSLSSCAAVTFACSNGAVDDNGHGTATASIAAGTTVTGGLMSGVAPTATVIAQKVLNANATGSDTDVANGIVNAANAGAQVINLSLTYLPTASVVNAINYAAAKGAILVFAGGNSAGMLNAGASSFGFSAAALSRLVFVGSVGPANLISSFSNTPGSGTAYAGATGTGYASLWLVAPGEGIIAPGIMYGPNAYAYWSGTSMAAPMVSGALALLETTWPVLARNGTAAALLFQTATNLGSKGADSIYGNGLLDLSRAFQPIGTLTVTAGNGRSMPVTQLSASLLSGGALGSLASLRGQLSSYTAFDAYQRNFLVDLGSQIRQRNQSGGAIAAATQAPAVRATTTRLAGGATLSFAQADDGAIAALGLTGRADLTGGTLASGSVGSRPGAWLMELTDAAGTTVAAGRGFPASASFADALWGAGSRAAVQSRSLGGSNALLGLAEGGSFGVIGTEIGRHTRVALTIADTQAAADALLGGGGIMQSLIDNSWAQPVASAIGLGISTRLAEGWSGGLTLGFLDEKNGLLGSTYDSGGLLGLGDRHRSQSLGLSTSFDLGERTGLLLDATLARTEGASVAGGLVTGVSSLLARSYGVALVRRDTLTEGDNVSLGLRKPLRVISGSAALATTSVDAQGFATTGTTRVGLRPTGSQTDLIAGYTAPLFEGIDMTAALNISTDAENVRGSNAAGARIAIRAHF